MEHEIIQKYQKYQSQGHWLKDLDPVNRINIWMAIGLMSMITKDWRFGLAACIFYVLVAVYLKILKPYLKLFGVCFVFLGLMTVLARVIGHRNEGTPLLVILGFPITDAALKNGLDMAFFLLGFSGAVFILFLTTPVRDIMLALEQRKWVKPSTSYIVLVSFKTITELGNNMKSILESQQARGIETQGNMLTRLKSAFPVITPTVLSAISYTEDKCISMESRAFAREEGHTYLRIFKPVPVWEKVLVAVVDICLVLVIAGKIYISVAG